MNSVRLVRLKASAYMIRNASVVPSCSAVTIGELHTDGEPLSTGVYQKDYNSR